VRYSLEGGADLKPYVLLAARLGEDAENNIGTVATHEGRGVLWAEQGPFALALSVVDDDGADAFGRRSVGCLAVSDGMTRRDPAPCP
jgi:glucoamylase